MLTISGPVMIQEFQIQLWKTHSWDMIYQNRRISCLHKFKTRCLALTKARSHSFQTIQRYPRNRKLKYQPKRISLSNNRQPGNNRLINPLLLFVELWWVISHQTMTKNWVRQPSSMAWFGKASKLLWSIWKTQALWNTAPLSGEMEFIPICQVSSSHTSRYTCQLWLSLHTISCRHDPSPLA